MSRKRNANVKLPQFKILGRHNHEEQSREARATSENVSTRQPVVNPLALTKSSDNQTRLKPDRIFGATGFYTVDPVIVNYWPFDRPRYQFPRLVSTMRIVHRRLSLLFIA